MISFQTISAWASIYVQPNSYILLRCSSSEKWKLTTEIISRWLFTPKNSANSDFTAFQHQSGGPGFESHWDPRDIFFKVLDWHVNLQNFLNAQILKSSQYLIWIQLRKFCYQWKQFCFQLSKCDKSRALFFFKTNKKK